MLVILGAEHARDGCHRDTGVDLLGEKVACKLKEGGGEGGPVLKFAMSFYLSSYAHTGPNSHQKLRGLINSSTMVMGQSSSELKKQSCMYVSPTVHTKHRAMEMRSL